MVFGAFKCKCNNDANQTERPIPEISHAVLHAVRDVRIHSKNMRSVCKYRRITDLLLIVSMFGTYRYGLRPCSFSDGSSLE